MIQESIRKLVVDSDGFITKSSASYTLMLGYEPYFYEPYYVSEARKTNSEGQKRKYKLRLIKKRSE